MSVTRIRSKLHFFFCRKRMHLKTCLCIAFYISRQCDTAQSLLSDGRTAIDHISTARRAHTPARCCSGQQMGQTDGRTPYHYIHPAAYYASSVNKSIGPISDLGYRHQLPTSQLDLHCILRLATSFMNRRQSFFCRRGEHGTGCRQSQN